MCNVKQVPSCDNRTSLFPLRGTLTGSSSSYTSFSVRIIQLFFQTPFPPNFLHAFSQQEQKQTFALSLTHTHTRDKKAFSVPCGDCQACADDDYWNLCWSHAKHGHPKTAQSHRNHQQPCCRSPPSFHPPFPSLPILSSTTNTAPQSLFPGMELRACGYFKTFTSESHIPRAKSLYVRAVGLTAYHGKMTPI